MICQVNATAGYCRYRQAIPVGPGGRLDINSNFGFRKSFLPQVSFCIKTEWRITLSSFLNHNFSGFTQETELDTLTSVCSMVECKGRISFNQPKSNTYLNLSLFAVCQSQCYGNSNNIPNEIP